MIDTSKQGEISEKLATIADARAAIEQGDLFFNKGDMNSAEKYYSKAIEVCQFPPSLFESFLFLLDVLFVRNVVFFVHFSKTVRKK